jgi:hypothetical protein
VQVPAGVREQRPGAGRRREPVVQHFLREHRRCRPRSNCDLQDWSQGGIIETKHAARGSLFHHILFIFD